MAADQHGRASEGRALTRQGPRGSEALLNALRCITPDVFLRGRSLSLWLAEQRAYYAAFAAQRAQAAGLPVPVLEGDVAGGSGEELCGGRLQNEHGLGSRAGLR